MAVMRVNPTRMELIRLKNRLQVAVRGHKLLKDKRDEMMRRFIDLIKRNKELRERVEQKLTLAFKDFLMARAVMSSEVLEEAIMFPTRRVEIKPSIGNIMGVTVPVIEYKEVTDRELSPYPYSFAATSAELDGAIAAFSDILPLMVELAQIEKTCQMLADEIEKTRRRVNALEYVVIPQLKETIRYITMKLDENERGNRTRLMKVKDMLEKKDATI
ncbi:MAG: V-type ATP synthase subunit D [Caldicoprobacter oshimai]|uniref:V-type ATP synthase subunit D n=1 Tax=Caldicoprobacter faecalis TaxID=937334 RepID=A0A1I5XDM7_9FIRM|nr:V-type ATP synthase subunit D [Caldicoprobacter faecalis]PZN09043.1 MAG: V-type ATP synthase subunit D [Caldicoprobacter oshimai]SFQ29757.1 V/A-type H+-transporting ATPase subunit D [Caldicoprobacter faecalis]